MIVHLLSQLVQGIGVGTVDLKNCDMISKQSFSEEYLPYIRAGQGKNF